MSIKLDQADRKVLLTLLKNSRMPIQQISKETKLSREIVQYRMKKLESEEVTKGYIARINQSYFCQGIAALFVKLSHITSERNMEIIKFLQNCHYINWISELCGNYDLTATITYDTSDDLSQKVLSITNFIGKNLVDQYLSIYITEFKFDRSGLIRSKPDNPSSDMYRPIIFNSSRIKLDKTDKTILSLLSKNSRIKNTEIAQKTKVEEDAIRIRIKKLEKSQVINGYTIILDPTRLGYESYYLLLSIENLNRELLSKIRYYAHNNPNIIFCVQTTGTHNMILNVMSINRKEFAVLFSKLRSEFPEIKHYEINFGMQEHKEIFVPFDS